MCTCPQPIRLHMPSAVKLLGDGSWAHGHNSNNVILKLSKGWFSTCTYVFRESYDPEW